jgi:hypothetical protein
MNYIFDNIFFNKETYNYDEFTNASYWIILMTKNILKWIFAVQLFEDKNYSLFFLLFIIPVFKFLAIGLGNIFKFKKSFRINLVITIMVVISIFECFIELPSHYFFPTNHIYLHTNYYKIYDLGKYRQLEVFTELLENVIIFIYLFFAFSNTAEDSKVGVGIVTILTLSFCLAIFVYYLLAEFYFTFLYKETKEVYDEFGRKMKINNVNTKIRSKHISDVKLRDLPHIQKSLNSENEDIDYDENISSNMNNRSKVHSKFNFSSKSNSIDDGSLKNEINIEVPVITKINLNKDKNKDKDESNRYFITQTENSDNVVMTEEK